MLGHMLYMEQAWGGKLKYLMDVLFELSYNWTNTGTCVTHGTSMGILKCLMDALFGLQYICKDAETINNH